MERPDGASAHPLPAREGGGEGSNGPETRDERGHRPRRARPTIPGVTERVLIAYSSKHGSTAEVAAAIGRRLEQTGFAVDVECAQQVRSIAQYQAVIVGSPLYAGHWPRETMGFLRKHRDELARMPVAAFALGPRGRPGDADWEKAERQLSAVLRKHPWLRPVSRTIVGGVIDPRKLRFPFSHMEPCDWRDWAAIEAWAESLAALRLHAAVAASGAA